MQLVGRGMQSLRRVQWEGAGSRGGRVAGETEELEEGEARSDSDDEAFVDPDVDLSYIVSTPASQAWHPPPSRSRATVSSAAGFLCSSIRCGRGPIHFGKQSCPNSQILRQ
jgi:hypothetical protein